MAFLGRVSGVTAAGAGVAGTVLLLLVVSQISSDGSTSILDQIHRRHQHNAALLKTGRAATPHNQQQAIKVSASLVKADRRPDPASLAPPHLSAHSSTFLAQPKDGAVHHKHHSSCFGAGTLVRMASGAPRRIESLRPGDLIFGGRVLVTMQRLMPKDDLFDYGGVVVRGDHSVLDEERGVWSFVRDAALARSLDPQSRPTLSSGDGAVLYDIIVTGHRMHTALGHLFADHMIFPETLDDKALMLNLLNRESASTASGAFTHIDQTAGEYKLEEKDALGSCFAGWTEVLMADNSRRRIESLRPGDETKGGNVITVRQHELGAGVGQLYLYGETVVSGNHPVREAGGRWRLVRQSVLARSVATETLDELIGQGAVGYDLLTWGSTIYTADGGVFADNSELLTEDNERDLLRRLNKEYETSMIAGGGLEREEEAFAVAQKDGQDVGSACNANATSLSTPSPSSSLLSSEFLKTQLQASTLGQSGGAGVE